MESNQSLSKDFIFGVITGVAIMAIIGLFYMSDGESSGNKTAPLGSGSAPTAAAPTPSNPSHGGAAPTAEVEVLEGDHIRGDVNAPITIVEFSDFQCPFCSRFHQTMAEVMANNDNVRWVYKHFPLDSIHPLARKAAEASECAGDQGKFWEYADELFNRQTQISTSLFSSLASDLGLNTGDFDSCLDSGKYADKVEADYQAGLAAGVRGTPGNFINGQALAGAVPYSQIQGIIDSL